MRYLVTILLLVLLTVSACSGFQVPFNSGYSWTEPFYGYGLLNTTVGQITTGESMTLSGWFHDDDDHLGYSFSLGEIGTVYTPYPDFAVTSMRGISQCWYENGWTGYLPVYVPAPSPIYGNTKAHACTIDGAKKLRSDFGQWMLQTSYPKTLYGRYRNSTIRAVGCCATAAAMQMHMYGINVWPDTVVLALNNASDGYGGKSGLQVNWQALQRIFDLGYKPNVSVREAQLRGMTIQEGVKFHGGIKAGHWVLPYLRTSTGANVMYDPMGRGMIDKEVYPDANSNYTRMIYPKLHTVPGLSKVSAQSTSSVDDDPDHMAPCLYYAKMAESSQQVVASSTLISDSPSMVEWSGSGVYAYPMTGDVRLSLWKTGAVAPVASDSIEVMENDDTGSIVQDVTLDAPSLETGSYILQINGVAGTAFTVQLYDYQGAGLAPVGTLFSGVIGADGTYNYSFTHTGTVTLGNLTDLDKIPTGSNFTIPSASVTAKISDGVFAMQAQARLQFPWTATNCGTLNPYSTYALSGTVTSNRTIALSAVAMVSSGSVSCVPVFRNNRSVFDPVAGYLYTKLVGKVTEIGTNSFTLDDILVRMTPPSWMTRGDTVSVCGVPVSGEFVGNPSTIEILE